MIAEPHFLFDAQFIWILDSPPTTHSLCDAAHNTLFVPVGRSLALFHTRVMLSFRILSTCVSAHIQIMILSRRDLFRVVVYCSVKVYNFVAASRREYVFF